MNFVDGPLDDFQTTQSELMIIDWINSLDIPSCTLADDIHDLKSGCVVADIVCWLYGISLPNIQRNISNRYDALHNWETIITALSALVPKSLLSRPEDFLDVNFK